MIKRLIPLLALLFLFALPAHGVILNVNSGTCAVGSHDCTITLSVVSGNTVIVAVATRTMPSTLTVSDTNSNSFVVVAGPFTDSGNHVIVEVWRANIGTTNAADVIDINNTNNALYMSGLATQYSGLASTPEDLTATNSYSATLSLTTAASGTTSQASEVIMGFMASNGDGGGYSNDCTAGSGYTLLNTSNCGGSTDIIFPVVYQIVSSTGSYTATATVAMTHTAEPGGAIIVTLKGAGGGGGVKRLRGQVISSLIQDGLVTWLDSFYS